MTAEKRAKTREMARELLRGSIIEDAAAQFLAQAIEEVHASRIAPMKDRLEKLEEENARLRAAGKALVDVIEGDLVGSEWKRACREVIADFRAIPKGEA